MVLNKILIILLFFVSKIVGIGIIQNSQCQTFTICSSDYKKTISLPYEHVLFKEMLNPENVPNNNLKNLSFDKFCFLLKVLEGRKRLKFVLRKRKLLKLLIAADQLGLNTIRDELALRCDKFVYGMRDSKKNSYELWKRAIVICSAFISERNINRFSLLAKVIA